MSLLSPSDAKEVSRSGWLMLPIIIGPMLALLMFWWQIYFTFEAVVKVAPIAIALGTVLGWLMYRRTVRLAELGLHPYYGPKDLPFANVLVMLLGVIFLAFAWTLGFFAIATLPLTKVEERRFSIAEVRNCKYKCVGCGTNARLTNWVGSGNDILCVDSLNPSPKVKEQVVVRGKFTDHFQYLLSIERDRR